MRMVARGAFVLRKGFGISGVLHQNHKSKVHVQLLMAMKKRISRIIRREVHLDDLIGIDDYRILQNAGCGFAVYLRQLETMSMQVQWVGVIAVIPEDHAISFSRVNHQRISMRIRLSVDRPAIEAPVTARNLFDD